MGKLLQVIRADGAVAIYTTEFWQQGNLMSTITIGNPLWQLLQKLVVCK